MTEILAGGGPRHRHVSPDVGEHSRGMGAYEHRWNTVARSSCGHLWVRRHSLGWLFHLLGIPADHYPQWVRLRPWHLAALTRMVFRR